MTVIVEVYEVKLCCRGVTFDVIKSKVYEQLGGGTGISVINIVMILLLACLIGVYIFSIYSNCSLLIVFIETTSFVSISGTIYHSKSTLYQVNLHNFSLFFSDFTASF